MLTSFIEYIKNEKRFSKNTLIAYEADLYKFTLYVQQLGLTYNQVSQKEVRSWLLSMLSQKSSPASVRRRIAVLRSFYKHLISSQQAFHNPAANITLPKISKKIPSFVKKNEILDIINNMEVKEYFEGLRDKLIIQLLYGTGIRAEELINIKEHDIDLKNCVIKVLGKGNKERLVPFPSSISKNLLLYLSNKPTFDKYTPNLIVTKKGKKAYYAMINRVVKKNLLKCSNLSKHSPHVLRHTFATHLLDNGAEINSIKEMLGHKSVTTTQIYTQTSMEKLKKVVSQAHPRY